MSDKPLSEKRAKEVINLYRFMDIGRSAQVMFLEAAINEFLCSSNHPEDRDELARSLALVEQQKASTLVLEDQLIQVLHDHYMNKE